MSQFNLRYVPTLSAGEFILNGQRFNTQGANINGTPTTALTTEVIINDQTKNQALFDEIAGNIHGNLFPQIQAEIDQLTSNVIILQGEMNAVEGNITVLQGNVVSLQNQINLLDANVQYDEQLIIGLQANTQYLRAPYNGQGGSTSYFTNGLQVWNGANESGNGIFSYVDGSAPTNQIRLSVQNAKKIFLDGGSTLIAPTSGGSVDIQGSGGTQPFYFNLKNPGLLNTTVRVAGDIELAGNGSSAISVYTEPGSLFPVPTNPIDRVDVRGGNETRIFGPLITAQADGGGRMDLSGGSVSIQASNGDAVSIQCESGSSNSDINIGTQQDVLATGYTTITLGSGNPTAIRNSSTFIEGDFYLPNNPATNTGLWDSIMYLGLPTIYSGPLHGPVKTTFNPYFRSISTFCPDSTVNSFVQVSGTFTVLVGIGAINLGAGAGGITMTVAGGAIACTALVGGMVFTTAGGAIQFTTGAGAYNVTTGAGPIQLETNTGDILIRSGGAPGGVLGSTYITPKDYLILDPEKQVIIGESGSVPSFSTLINTLATTFNSNVFTSDITGNVVMSNVFQTGTAATYLRPIQSGNLTYTGNVLNPNTLYGNAYMTIVNADTNAVLYTSATTLITGTLNGYNFGSNQLLPASSNLVAKIYPEGNISNYQYGTFNSNVLVNSNVGVQINVEISGNSTTTTAYVNTFGNSYFQNELILNNYTPTDSTYALYNVSGILHFNGSPVGIAGNNVERIIAGNGIEISPISGVGNVIVSLAGSVIPPGGYLPVNGGQMNGDILMAGNAAIYQGISGTIPKDQIKLYRPMSSYQAPFPNIGPPTYTGELLTFYNGDNSGSQSNFIGWFPQSLFPYQPSAMTQQIPGATGFTYNQANTGTPQNASYVGNATITINQGQKFNVGSVFLNQANTELPLRFAIGAPDFTALAGVNFPAGSFPSSGLFSFNMNITWNYGTASYWKVWWEQDDNKLLVNVQNPSAQFNNNWCGTIGYADDPFYIVAVPYLNQNLTVIYKWVDGLNDADKLFSVDGIVNGIYEGQIGNSFLYFYGLFNNYIDSSQTLRVNNLFQWNVYTGGVFKVLSESNLVQNEPVGTNGAVRGVEVDTANNRTWIYGDFDSYGTDANGNPVTAGDVALLCGCTFTKTDTWAIGPTVLWEGIQGFKGVKAGKLLDATANYVFMCWAEERWDSSSSSFLPYSEIGTTFFDGTNWLPNVNATCLDVNDGISTVVSNIQFINDYSGGGYKIFFTGTFTSATVGNTPQTCYSITYTQGGGTFNSSSQRYQYGLNLCCNNQDATFWIAPNLIGILNLRRMSNGLMIMNTDGYLISGNGAGVMSFDLSNIATPASSPIKYGIPNTPSYSTNVIIGTDSTKVKLVAGLNTNNFFWSQILDISPQPAPGDATVYAINGAKFLVDNHEMDKIVFAGNNQNYSSVSFIAGKVEDNDFNWYWSAQVGALDYFSGNVFYPNLTAVGNINAPIGSIPTLNAVLSSGNSGSNQSMTDLNDIGCISIQTGKVYQGNNLNLQIGEAGDTLLIKGATVLGSLLVGDGVNTEELTVGANNYVLRANALASLGVEWSAEITPNLGQVLAVGNSSDGYNINLNGNILQNCSEITATGDLLLNPVGSVDLNGKTLNMTNGEIHNVPLIHSQNNTDLTLEAKGTGNLLFTTNNITRMTIVDTGSITYSGGAVYDPTTNRFGNVANPIAAQDVATKNYVDSLPPSGLPAGSFTGDYIYWNGNVSPPAYVVGNTQIRLGSNAGNINMGVNSIAIGHNAGTLNQSNNSIIINAEGTPLNTSANANVCYIAPIRNANVSYDNFLNYDPSTKEVVYNYFMLPVGNTDQRPPAPVLGMMRYNTTTNKPEIYNGVIWAHFTISGNPFPGGNQSTADLYTLMASMTNKAEANPTAGGSLTLNSVLIGNYDYTIKNGNQSITSFINSEWFTATEDSNAALICVDGDLTINTGQTFIPTVRKLFTCIYVSGNLNVIGGISMTGRGAKTISLGVQTATIRIVTGTYSSVTNPQVPGNGGDGGAGTSGANGNSGISGSNGQTGGGGGGGSYLNTSGAGSQGSSFSGGCGGGGSNSGVGNMNAEGFGGQGGTGRNVNGGNQSSGGTGNPGGPSIDNLGNVNPATGTSGTGGTLIIFVEGALQGSGTISCNGVAGTVNAGVIGPGGGSGGGSLTIICNTDTSTLTRTATGGAGGIGWPSPPYNQLGGAGGNGTSRTLTGL